MHKTAKVLNWLVLALWVVSTLGLYRWNPNRNFVGAFLLYTPYLSALLAFREDSKRGTSYFALALNGLFFLSFLVFLVAIFFTPVFEPVFFGIFISLTVILPIGLNLFVLINQLRLNKPNKQAA